LIKICFATLIILFALFATANASTITFDSYTDIQSIEADFNVDFSSLWDVKTNGSTNTVGFYINEGYYDDTVEEQFIAFKTGPVLVESATIKSMEGAVSGYLNGVLVGSSLLPLASPTTTGLMNWGFIDTLVFDSYMLTLDNLTFEPKPTPVPSGLLLLGTGLIGFFGIVRRFKK
jgi:hypothetical protein